MKQDDALRIVGYLSAAFPDTALEQASVVVFAKEISLLASHSVAVEAAQNVARNDQKFPSIRRFREAYMAVNEAHKPRSIDAPLPSDPRPEWVDVWYWLRHHREPRETRALPQQRIGFEQTFAPGDVIPTYMTVAEYKAFYDEWVAAGKPRFSMGRALAGAR